MIATPLTKTIKTDPDEIQVRNELDHQRVYDPDANEELKEIKKLLKQVVQQLSYITGEENDNR